MNKQTVINRLKIFQSSISLIDKLRLTYWSVIILGLKKIFRCDFDISVKLDKKGPKIFLSNGADLATFIEVFVSRAYEINTEKKINRILDLGANVGYSSIFFSDKFNDAQIIAVEADIKNIEHLKRNTKDNINVLVHYGAVSGTTGTTKFYQNFQTSTAGSIIARDRNAKIQMVPAFTLSDLEKKYGRFDIIKFDIEGAEWVAIQPLLLEHKPFVWLGEYHTDLICHRCSEFLERFVSYSISVRDTTKRGRSIVSFVQRDV